MTAHGPGAPETDPGSGSVGRASQVQRFFCTGTIEEMIGPRVVTRPALSAAASGG